MAASRRLCKNPDVATVARLAKVSTATVSRVLNGFSGVSPETRDLVSRTLAKVGYRPEGRRGGVLAILVEGKGGIHLGAYQSHLLGALSQVLLEEGYAFEIMPVGNSREVEERAFFAVISLTHSQEADRYLDQLDGGRLICLNHVRQGAHGVFSDHDRQMALAVGRLHAAGHRQIALVRSTGEGWGAGERGRGFLRESKIRGLKGSVNDVAVGDLSNWVQEKGMGAATAVVGVGEELALPLMGALARGRLRVPEDISVVLMENPWVSPYLVPRPSGIRQGTDLMARAAVALLKKIPPRGRKPMPIALKAIEPHWMPGESVGPPRGV